MAQKSNIIITKSHISRNKIYLLDFGQILRDFSRQRLLSLLSISTIKWNEFSMDLKDISKMDFSFFSEITGEAMTVYNKYKYGLLESAYEAALKYLLELNGHTVERQKNLPMYWDDVQLDQHYRIDLVIDNNIILELKAISHIDTPHRRQLWSYMNLTHLPYGMLINFSPDGLYSEWYCRDNSSGEINRIRPADIRKSIFYKINKINMNVCGRSGSAPDGAEI